MPLGEVLGLQDVERDLDPVADRDVADVRDAAPLGDLGGEGVDVRAEDAAGEAHHHRRVERLVGAQAVDRELAVLVAVLEEEGLLGHRQGRAERRAQQLGGDGHRRAARHVVVPELVVLADGAGVLPRAGEPDREAPEALALHGTDAADLVDPAVGRPVVVGEQGAGGLELPLRGEEVEGDRVAGARLEIGAAGAPRRAWTGGPASPHRRVAKAAIPSPRRGRPRRRSRARRRARRRGRPRARRGPVPAPPAPC